MIDLLSETIIPISEVSKLLPSSRPGKKLNAATVFRWAQSGRLETVKVGGARYTSREALARFAQPTARPPAATPAKTQARREQDIAAAEERLRARGVR